MVLELRIIFSMWPQASVSALSARIAFAVQLGSKYGEMVKKRGIQKDVEKSTSFSVYSLAGCVSSSSVHANFTKISPTIC